MSKIFFNVAHGLKVQQEQLQEWRRLLRPAIYAELVKRVERANSRLKPRDDGYDVLRGMELTNLVLNLRDQVAKMVEVAETKRAIQAKIKQVSKSSKKKGRK